MRIVESNVVCVTQAGGESKETLGFRIAMVTVLRLRPGVSSFSQEVVTNGTRVVVSTTQKEYLTIVGGVQYFSIALIFFFETALDESHTCIPLFTHISLTPSFTLQGGSIFFLCAFFIAAVLLDY